MSRTGTCVHAVQVLKKEIIPIYGEPVRTITLPNEYDCGWLSGLGELPPAVARWRAGHEIREGDCEACPRYTPAADLRFLRNGQ